MRGIVLSAYVRGNSIPYTELAVLSALLIRRNLSRDIPITLFVDKPAWSRIRDDHPEKAEFLFTTVVEDNQIQEPNLRIFAGSDGKPAQFNNRGRTEFYHRAAYDEMLILDTDYLIYENSLDQVWGSPQPIRMNRYTSTIRKPLERTETRLGKISIPQFWATAVYLRRCGETDRFIQLVEYARDNYEWFSHVYRFERAMYRNDFTFSIAAHLLGGQVGGCPSIGPLPNDTLRFAWDEDRVLGHYKDGLLIHAHDREIGFQPVRTTDQSIHILNKGSLVEHLPGMIDQAWADVR